MKKLTLIRHGMPDFPQGQRVCIGLTDTPLGTLGKLQACLYGDAYKADRVYSSYLSRAVQTARFISPDVRVVSGLEEMYAGEWEGLCFSEIKLKYPEIFALRGTDPDTAIPGSEDVYSGQERFYNAVKGIMEKCDGNAAIVAHSTVIGSFLCRVKGLPPTQSRRFKLPYCGACSFNYDGDFHLLSESFLPEVKLNAGICRKLLSAAELPENVIEHCEAVAKEAVLIAEALKGKGFELDLELIENAALLHDIARLSPNHPSAGAELLAELGFNEVSEVIRQHHDLKSTEISEASVVYIADKLIEGDKKISIADRFSASLNKCKSPEALESHGRRQAQAEETAGKIENILGTKLPL